jgi:hypothetical protein
MFQFVYLARRVVVLAALAVGMPVAAYAQAASVDPEALKLLRRMTDYMAALPQFSFDTHDTLEAVLKTGQKLDFDFSAKVAVQRPNRLRAERHNDIVNQKFFYDGKTLTLYNPDEKFYATEAVPATLEQALDFARTTLDVAAPASDLLYQDAFARLTQDVTGALVVGQAAIGGVRCTQLAFTGPQVDWQVWIAEGDKPLPYKYVITTKDVAGLPAYSMVLSNWNLSPAITDSVFEFTPPQGARKINFLRLTQGGAAR